MLKNININRGVLGTSSSYNYINIDTINSEQEINVNQVDGIVSIGDILSIKYESLKNLRDNYELIPGRQYRIIDYVTTSSYPNTRVTNNSIDLIVTALDSHTLNEDAYAVFPMSEEIVCTVKYDLDNNTNLYEWASDTNIPILKKLGTHPSNDFGFTYKATNNEIFAINEVVRNVEVYTFSCNDYNDYPDVKVFVYDAKHYRVVDGNPTEYSELDIQLPGKGVIYYMKDEFGNEAGYDFKNILFKKYYSDLYNIVKVGDSNIFQNISEYLENTIPFTEATSLVISEASWHKIFVEDLDSTSKFFYTFHNNDEDASLDGYASNNIILPNYVPETSYEGKTRRLNGTIFIGNCFANKLGLYNYDNILADSYRITMEDSCGKNRVINSNNITLKNSCNGNNISISNDCLIDCNSRFNVLFETSYSNFGKLCEGNFTSFSTNNILENNCSGIVIIPNNGFTCTRNIFKLGCSYIAIEECSGNIFYPGTSHLSNVKNVVNSNIYAINYSLKNNVNVPFIDFTSMNNVTGVSIRKNSSGEIKVYCEADLIA